MKEVVSGDLRVVNSNPPPPPAAVATAEQALAALEPLQQAVHQLEAQQSDFIEAELRHLRELAVLNRMSDALAERRSFKRVLADAVCEAARVVHADRVWILEPGPDGALRRVHAPPEQSAEIAGLPLEARDLFERLIAENPSFPLVMPHYDPKSPEGVYVGLPIASAKHRMGALIFHSTDPVHSTDNQQVRLLQSMLHHTAIGCENARLIEGLSSMIVDVVVAMAMAIESRDPYTGGHVLRVTAYSLLLGQRIGLEQQAMSLLRLGGLLHDIGKVAVPDAILRKPGRLTVEEFEIMKTHAAVGHQIIAPIPQLAKAGVVVRHHHERWDGKGYPDGLGGEDIPILARIAAIADTFDAMTSDRPYRRGMPFEDGLAEIRRCSGTQFDPDLTPHFLTGEPDRFATAVAQMQQWREGGSNRHQDATELVELLDLGFPKGV